MANKKWSEMSPGQQAAVLTLISVELSLTVTALVDLYRRPADRVRGRKALWVPAIFVQPVGPVAYLVWGAKRG